MLNIFYVVKGLYIEYDFFILFVKGNVNCFWMWIMNIFVVNIMCYDFNKKCI